MQCIIVDNGSYHLTELVNLCGRDLATVVPVDALRNLRPPLDAIFVLSGSHSRGVLANQEYYRPELELIARPTRPIIGICLGFELIAHQAGAKLVRVNDPEVKSADIFPTPEGKNWFGTHSLPVAEGHRWVVSETPPGYITLATSSYGIEAIADVDQRIVGFQFHPEHETAITHGTGIFRNVLARLQAAA